jgi:hypothetical protein
MGKFFVGFLIGGAIGVGAALLLSAKTESNDGLVASVQSNVRDVVDAAKQAAADREQELWSEYRARLAQSSTADLDPM